MNADGDVHDSMSGAAQDLLGGFKLRAVYDHLAEAPQDLLAALR